MYVQLRTIVINKTTSERKFSFPRTQVEGVSPLIRAPQSMSLPKPALILQDLPSLKGVRTDYGSAYPN